MSSPTGGSLGITLTPEETRLFGQLFSQHDTEGTGIVLGDSARLLFERSGLPPKTLGQIWQLSDTENRGFLDQVGFSKALRMIYHVQHGKVLGPRLMTIPSGLPSFDRAVATETPAADIASPLASPPPTAASPSASSRIPPLSTADKQRFGSLFDRSTSGPTMDGTAAKDIFLKARLSTDVLGKIWNLVDVQGRGSLTRNEFVLAMHLIQAFISGTIAEVPASLPEGWIPWLEGGVDARGSVTSLGSATGPAPAAAPPAAAAAAAPAPAAPGPISWTVSSSQLAQYRKYFDSLDTQKRGVLGAAEVVPFLTQSKLSEEVLAQVWDLADLQGQGQFTRSEFAIAMYLIQARLAGHELPETLPPSLLDSTKLALASPPLASPSPRLQATGTGSRPAPPAARVPSRTTTASSLNDLVSLDDYFKPMEPTVQSPQSTGLAPVQRPGYTGPGLNAGAAVAAGAAGAAGAAVGAAAASTFKPASSFGQRMFSGSREDAAAANAAVGALSSEATERKTQLGAVTAESKAADEQLAAAAAQKSELEKQIAELRKSYDSEATKVHQTRQALQETQEAMRQLEKDQKLRESGLKALESQHEADSAKLAEATTAHEALVARLAELEEQHGTHQSNLDGLRTETEHLHGQHESYNQRVAAMEAELQQTLDSIESAKLAREDAEAKSREAKERAERLEAEVVATQQQHSGLLAETERLLAEAAEHTKRAAAAESQVADTHAQIAAERTRQASTATLAAPAAAAPSVGGTTAVDAAAATVGAAALGAAAAAAVSGGAGASTTSSPLSTHQTQPTDTPHSSPPNSEYAQYGEAPAIPSFTLPMARPQSATSSVMNNPPQSVRGDLDVSQPQSPVFATSEPVSGLVPPETLKLSDTPADDTDSFEFVDAREGRDEVRLASTGTLTQPPVGHDVGSSETVEPPAPAQPTTPRRGDDFASAFDDLEETVEDAEEDDFTGFGNATPSQPTTGPDEWQKLFEDAPAMPAAPSQHEAAISELTSMGFAHEQVLAALQRTDFNVSEATNILLDQE